MVRCPLTHDAGARVFVSMDGKMSGSSYPKRSFCVFETTAAIEGGATLMIRPPMDGPVAPPNCR